MRRIAFLMIALLILVSCSQYEGDGVRNHISITNRFGDSIYWSINESSSTEVWKYSILPNNGYAHINTEASTEYTISLYSYDGTENTISENQLIQKTQMELIDEFHLSTTLDYNAITIKSDGTVSIISK